MDAPDRIWLDRFYTEEITGGHFRCTRYRMNTGAGGDIEYVQASAVKAEANAPADPALLALAKFAATVIQSCIGRVEPLTMDDVLALGWKSGICEGSSGRMVVPGVHDAIAALLAPDGAASEGVGDGD